MFPNFGARAKHDAYIHLLSKCVSTEAKRRVPEPAYMIFIVIPLEVLAVVLEQQFDVPAIV